MWVNSVGSGGNAYSECLLGDVGAKYRCRALRNLEMSGRRAVKGSQEEYLPGLSLFAPALSREG